ncbi:AI-2E family transporter [Streptomonospora wellingtoniae]|uniref:AI-2E family transporter n=1 Tax=Streptomonospora wellingtoniae TaxID=3075544 RepID=A0ABU2L0Q9_9ACTN|nr:AI-2E family transporter [Streptomonospora sp. DSM 45055]MDT0305115.1 AI-2E family transporter [Streptomonospora sp. DSM 45055]
MRLTRPWEWSLLKRRRAPRAAPSEPPAAAAPEPAADPHPPEPDNMLVRMGNVAWRLLLIGVVAVLIVYGLVYIRIVTIPVILAVFVTALLMPPTNWMRRKGMGRGSSTAVACVGALVLLAGVITLIVQPAISGFAGLVDSVDQAINDLPRYLQTFGLNPDLAATTIEAAERELRSRMQEDWSQWVSQAWVAGTTVLEILLGVILIVVLTVYFVHSGDLLMEWVRSLFPRQSRASIKAASEIAYGVMGRYVRGVALVGLIDAVGIGLFLVFLIDPALAIPLIVLTFVGAFLPVIGAFLTGLLAALVALVTEGWIIAILVVAVVVVVQQLESHVFAPRVYGKALELPSAVVLLVITIGGILGAIAGMFLATPVVAVLAALLRNRPLVEAARSGHYAGAGGRPSEVASSEASAEHGGGRRAPAEREGTVSGRTADAGADGSAADPDHGPEPGEGESAQP